MSFQLKIEDIKSIIVQLANTFNQQKDHLNELDSKIGDGDHGLSMSRGFNAMTKYLDSNPDLSISDILIQGGMQFNEVTGSTIGILIFSAMRAAGLTVKDKTTVNFKDLRNMLEASIEAIKKRGKAQRGQKTILDTLIPTLEYLNNQRTINETKMIKETVKVAYQSAEETKDLEPQIGRSRWFKERSIGVIDPGAYTGYLIIKTIGEYIAERFYN
jgi:phosphoenolpyruvate---glycerone phosphotransferase subunit DhaL